MTSLISRAVLRAFPWLSRKQASHRGGRRRPFLGLEALEDRIVPSGMYDTVATGLHNQFVNSLDKAIAGGTGILSGWTAPLPVVGSALKDVSGTVLHGIDDFCTALQSSVGGLDETLAQSQVQDKVYGLLQNAHLLPAASDDANPVQVTGLNVTTHDVTFVLHLVYTDPTGTNLSFSLGLPALPVSLSGTVSVRPTVECKNLTFGLHGGSFFFQTSQAATLKAGISAYLPPGPNGSDPLTGHIGFLALTAAPANADAPQLSAGVQCDLGAAGVANPRLYGTATVNLRLNASFDKPTDAPSFPSFQANFGMNWDINGASPTSTDVKTFGAVPSVSFTNVQLDLGSFLSNLMKPLVQTIQDVTAPIQPILAILNKPIPGLSDLGQGDVTLVSLVNELKGLAQLPPDWQAVISMATAITQVTNLIDNIQIDQFNHMLVPVGDLPLSDLCGDLRAPQAAEKVSVDQTDLIHFATDAALKALKRSDLASLVPSGSQQAVQNLMDRLKSLDNQYNLSFPILDDPLGSAMQLFLGQDVDFVSFTGQFAASAVETQVFPFYGPLSVRFTGQVAIDTYFKVAYDTYGLRKFIADGAKNLTDIAAGFYLGTTRPLFHLNGSLAAEGQLSAGVFSAGVGGGLQANDLTIRLHDTYGTGKSRLFDDPPDPGSPATANQTGIGGTLFDTSGTLVADLYAFVRAGVDSPFGFAGVEKQFGLGSITLLDLANGSIPNPYKSSQATLATLGTDGTLTLNVGPRAALRGIKTDVKDENYYITPGTDPGSVRVSAFGLTQVFPNVRLLSADTGDGNDSIIVGPGVHAPAQFSHTSSGGGARFIYGGDGSANLRGADGGTNVLTGGAGSNVLTGGAAANNTLTGGTGHNYLVGGANSINLLVGGAGTNVLRGGTGGSNTLLGGDGPNDLRGGDGAQNRLVGGKGLNTLVGGSHLDTGTDYSTDRAQNDLVAGPGDDTLLGGNGADNTLVAGAGHDTLLGGDAFKTSVVVIPPTLGPPIVQYVYWAPTNTVIWTAGNGNPAVLDLKRDTAHNYAGGTLDVIGSNTPDFFTVLPEGPNLLIYDSPTVGPVATIHARNAVRLNIDGRGGQDSTYVGDLTTTILTDLGVNLGKALAPDGDPDLIYVSATAGADNILVQTESVFVRPQYASYNVPPSLPPGPGGPSSPGWSPPPGDIHGQVLKLTGLGQLTIRTAMLEDQLYVAGNGGGDTFAFKTGVATPPNPDTHRGLVTFAATGSANNSVSFTETFTADDTIALSAGRISSQILPFDVNYVGQGTTFGLGVTVSPGTGHNTVNVQSTAAGAVTTVNLSGDDRVNVSSDAPTNNGTLDGLAGRLSLNDNSGLTGVTISERGRTTPDAVKIAASGVWSVMSTLPWRVDTNGRFAHGVAVYLGTGADVAEIDSTVPGGNTTLNTGGGWDHVSVHVDSASLAHPDLLIDGGPKAIAVLNVYDDEDGAVMHNDTANGVLRVWYVSGTPSSIAYRNFAWVIPSVDADHSFVRSLFHTILHRNALTAEIEPLVTLLRQQTDPDPAVRRAVIASQLEHSAEALGLLVDRWYPAILGSTPTAAQRLALVRSLQSSAAPEEQLVRVLSNSAVDRRGLGLAPFEPAEFVTRIYQQLLLRAPTGTEMSAALSLINTQGAGELGYRLITSSEYRGLAVDSYYRRILRRSPTATERSAAVASALDLTSLRVQIEAGAEFYDTGI
jgi:hypothetical protein